MRLLMISGDRLVANGKKGAFWYTLSGLSRHWTHIDVLCPATDTGVRSIEGTTLGLPANIVLHPNPRGLLWQPWWIVRQGKRLHAKHPFAVATVQEYPPFYNGLGAAVLHRRTGIPYAIEIHHLVGEPHSASLAEWVGRWLSRILLATDVRPAAAVRVVNGGVAAQLQNWGVPGRKIHLVPSFYLDRAQLAAIDDQPIRYDLVACGRLVANKNLGALIDCLPKLPEATLLIIGDGPEREALERHATALGVRDRVQFAGWLADQPAVLASMKSARVFVMPSRSEGGPRVLLEAMVLGMPVVATKVGIAPDVIEHGQNGLLTSGTSVDLTRQISALLSDARRRKALGHQAQLITQRFNRDTLLKNYADFLVSLI